MTEERTIYDVINELKSALVPQGTLPVVRLFLNSSSYFNKPYIDECIQDLEKAIFNISLGEPLTALQKLAINVLLDSAYIERDL